MADTKEATVPLSCLLPAPLSRRVTAYGRGLGLSRTSAVIMLLNRGLDAEGQTVVPLPPQNEET
jgi:hypothetical protein